MAVPTQNSKTSKTSTTEQIANIIGIVSVVTALVYLVKSIADKTDTKIISNDARRVLKDKDEALRLRKAIDTYHVTGDWKKTEINDIL